MRLKRTLIGIGILLALAVAGIGAAAWWLTHRLDANIQVVDLPSADTAAAPGGPTASADTPTGSPSETAPATLEGPQNILLLGSDTRHDVGSGFGSESSIGGARSDTAILIHVSGDRQWLSGVSIPRDMVTVIPTELPACGKLSGPVRARFNEAFNRGGPACSVATAERLTGLHIDHVVAVDFAGFIRVIDTLGGLQVCLTSPLHDPEAKLNLPAGQQMLSGRDALALVRARKTIGDGSDLSRTTRQQYLLKLLAYQVRRSNLLTDPTRLFEVADAVTSSLATDKALASTTALLDFAYGLKDVRSDRIHLTTLPWTPDPTNPKVTVVLDRLAAERLLGQMRSDTEPGAGSRPSATSPATSTTSTTTSEAAPPPALLSKVFCAVH